MSEPLKLGIVIPRFHTDVVGGAELHGFRLAKKLSEVGHSVELVTTTAINHFTWVSEQAPGVEVVGDLRVRRFEVSPRDARVYQELEVLIGQGFLLTEDEEETWLRNGVSSSAMESFLRDADYDAILPLPYLFGTTYFAYRARPEITIPIPCLHDEPYAYMNFTRNMLAGSLGVMFNTQPEASFGKRIAPKTRRHQIVALGFEETKADSDPSEFSARYGIASPALLYVGRREQGKNIPKLIDYFIKFKSRNPTPLQLVLVGSGDIDVPDRPDIRVFHIDWSEISDLYRSATVFCQPSVNESLSIVLLQAWLAETAVLVNGDCSVTRDHCARSNGGLWFTNFAEFEETLLLLLSNSHLRHVLGSNGRRYVEKEYSWDAVMRRFHAAIYEWLGRPTGAEPVVSSSET